MQEMSRQNEERKKKKITCVTSWDDGGILDLRLAVLLKKYNLQATFFIPSNCELSERQIKELGKDFEIGGHTISHPMDLKQLSDYDLYDEISGNKRWLEYLLDREIDYFCYPRGRYNERVIRELKKVGFKKARTTIVGDISEPDEVDLFRINTTIHVHPERVEYHGRNWVEVANEFWEKALNTENSQFHIWGHSWELTKFDLWDDLEQLFKNITK